jgi:hypothetical protein
MKVKLRKDTELEVSTGYDEEGDIANTETESYAAGTELEFEIVDFAQRMVDGKLVDDPDTWNIQLGDGSVAFGVSKDWFDIIEADEEDLLPINE